MEVVMDITCDDLRKFVGGQVRIKRFRRRQELIGKLVYVGRVWALPGDRKVSLLRFAWLVRLDRKTGAWQRVRRRHHLLNITGYRSRLMDGDLVFSPDSTRGQVLFCQPRRRFFSYRQMELLEPTTPTNLLEEEGTAV